MTSKELKETYDVWKAFVESAKPPKDNEESEIHFWLRDASPEDLWKAMRAVHLKGKEPVPF